MDHYGGRSIGYDTVAAEGVLRTRGRKAPFFLACRILTLRMNDNFPVVGRHSQALPGVLGVNVGLSLNGWMLQSRIRPLRPGEEVYLSPRTACFIIGDTIPTTKSIDNSSALKDRISLY